LLLYVAYLQKEGLKASSVKVYLAAVRAYHIDNGYGNPMESYLRVLKAVRAMDICSEGPNQKLPITYQLMNKLKGLLADNFDCIVIWAAMTLGYFGCLRASEFTVTEGHHFTPKVHLAMQDVAMNNHPPHYMVIRIKRSKTDKLNEGFDIYIPCTNNAVCGFCAITQMLHRRIQLGLTMSTQAPLFMFRSGIAITRTLFVQQTRLWLAGLGIDGTKYSGHSFRAGSATTAAAAAGMPDWQIKLLGRWKSDCYQTYIRTPVSQRLGFGYKLVK
jgi:hypothetical protein